MRTLPFTWPCSHSSSFKPTLLISLPKLLSFPYTIVGTSCSSFYRHFSLSFSFFLINKSTLSFFIIYKIKPCILVFSISKVFNISQPTLSESVRRWKTVWHIRLILTWRLLSLDWDFQGQRKHFFLFLLKTTKDHWLKLPKSVIQKVLTLMQHLLQSKFNKN